MRVFVTGATGVVGRGAVPLMLALGHHVTAVARSREKRAALEKLGAATVALELFNIEMVRKAVAGHDVVVNLATHIPKGTLGPFLPGAWRETDRLRRDASAILADAAERNGAQRFVQESFAPIYPDSADHWITESVEPRPAQYNRSTLDAEASAARFTQSGGRGIVLRFAFFYGSQDGFTRQLFKNVRRGWLPVFGKPNAYFSLVSHEDAAAAVVAALNVPAGVYNVVDDEPLTRRQLGDAIAALLNGAPPKIPPPWIAKLGGSIGETIARSLRISNGKLRAASAWAPRYPSAREGLAAVMPA